MLTDLPLSPNFFSLVFRTQQRDKLTVSKRSQGDISDPLFVSLKSDKDVLSAVYGGVIDSVYGTHDGYHR